jgi:hypothetical protein
MKNITTIIRNFIILLCVGLFSGISAHAAAYGDTLYSVYNSPAAYNLDLPEEKTTLANMFLHPYTGPLPAIGLALWALFMGYVLFRYWYDNRSEFISKQQKGFTTPQHG